MFLQRILPLFLVILFGFAGCSGDKERPLTGPASGDIDPDPVGDGGGGGGGDDDGPPDVPANDTSGFKGTWDISRGDVALGCSFGLDCIPSIDSPRFVSLQSANFMRDDEIVYGLVVDGEARAFPEKILDWHEIVNLEFGFKLVTLSYCPLTGSAIAMLPPGDDEGLSRTFGVSGFLYNNNLLPYDRATASAWSQMYMRCVNGVLRGVHMRTVPLLETSWAGWKKMFPGSTVLTDDTGFNRNYDAFPYGNYREVEDTLFPLTKEDRRLFFKERVHGIVTDRDALIAKTYRFNLFENGVRAVNDEVDGQPVVVAGAKFADLYLSYFRTLFDGTVLTFETRTESPSIYPFDLVDNEGTVWNILGEAVSGPRTGQKLRPTVSYNAYWFSWGSLYPDVPIFE